MKRAVLVLLFSLAALAQTKIAIVRQSTGDVSVRHGSRWAPVTQTPVELFDGDTVATDRGRAEIFYPSDGSTLTVDVGSNVTIHQTDTSGGWLRRVRVYVGDVFFHISKTAETNNKWQLATPTAVGGVQGTEGQIHVEDEENSDFTLSEGALEVRHLSANGVPLREEQPVRIGAGETVRARPGIALARAKAVMLPRAPRVNVKPEELPQPKPGHVDKVRSSERPPRGMGAAATRTGALNNPNPARPGATTRSGVITNENIGQSATSTEGATPKPGAAARENAEPRQRPMPGPGAATNQRAVARQTNAQAREEKKKEKEKKKEEEKPKKPVRRLPPPRV